MSFIYDYDVIAAARESESRRNTRALVISILTILLVVIAAIGIYYLVKRRQAELEAQQAATTQ